MRGRKIVRGLKPYRTAAECIDFSLPCPSIFMTREQARQFQKSTGIRCNRPLKKKTCWRIANGLKRFVIESKKPFIVRCAHGDQNPNGTGKRWGRSEHPADEPLPTVTGSKDFAAVAPALAKYYGQGDGQPANDPLHTVTTKDRFGLIAANLVNVQHGGHDAQGRSVEQPLNTVTAKHGNGVVASEMVPFVAGCGGRAGQSLPTPADAPIGTITAKNDRVVASALITKFRGDSVGTPADEPLPTITAGGQAGGREAGAAHAMGAVSATLVEVQNSNWGTGDRDVDRPMPTVTANPKGGGWATAVAFLSKLRGSGGWKPADAPLDVVCAGAPTFGAVSAFITKFYGTATGQSILEPLATVTANAGGGHLGAVHAILSQGVDEAALAGFWQVYSFLVEHLGKDAPLPFLEVAGEVFLIVDVGMRMLEPRELLNAQFTPEIAKDYILPKNKALAVRLIGNSVSPPVLEAVIRAQNIHSHRKAA
jgi:DNA (cytosine-5)-methyltransferase 1